MTSHATPSGVELSLTPPLPASSSREGLMIAIISAIFVGVSTSLLGVWELSEATHADLLAWMWSHETWMQVNIPTSGSEARAVSELAVGWWPSLISMHTLPDWISPELRLRLPFVIISGLVAGSMYTLAHLWRGARSIALLATTLLLITPALALGGRHSLATGGLGAWLCALATLSLLNAELSSADTRWARGWYLLGFGALVLSAGSLGLIGLISPLLIWGVALKRRYRADQAQHAAQELEGSPRSLTEPTLFLGSALIMIGLIYWRSWVKRASGVDAWSLYVTLDPLSEAYRYEDWSGFQDTLHLIGYGLFPLGAFLPVFSQALKRGDQAHRTAGVGSRSAAVRVGDLMTLSFIVSFFSVVLLAPKGGYWGGGSAILAVPLALGVASFMHDGLERRRALPLYLLAVILFWILIDSDLKREPGLLLSSLSGADPKGLLPELRHWRWARLLTFGAIGWILLYHTSICRRALERVSAWFKRSTRDPYHFHPGLIIISIAGGLGCLLPQTISAIPRWVVANAFTVAPFWGRASMTSRLFVLTMIGVVGGYWIAHLSWRLIIHKRLSVEARQRDLFEWAVALSLLIITPHYLGRLPVWKFMRGVLSWMEADGGSPLYLRVLLVHLWVIFGLWAILLGVSALIQRFGARNALSGLSSLFDSVGRRVSGALTWILSASVGRAALALWLGAALAFSQYTLPRALSAQLSHHDLIERSQRAGAELSDLNLYLVRPQQRGFYLRDLKELKQSQFQSAAKGSERSFFVIERDQLSKANRHFREATERHLPILDDQHHKLLIASNTLAEGEEDRNPIKRAVISELPPKVNRISEPINFEDKVELVGWKLTPSAPRPGTPAKLEMFWRAKRRLRSDWKVFVHIDAPGQRIHGDHEPVSGVYSMKDWRKGDLIADEHHINIARTIRPATFTFFAGLYRGKTRMKIKNTSDKLKDKENRAKIGRIRVP